VKFVLPTPETRAWELESSRGQRRVVQAQLGLGPGVSSLAPALRNGITRGVLSLTFPRTPALSHNASPSSTHHSRPWPCSKFLKKSQLPTQEIEFLPRLPTRGPWPLGQEVQRAGLTLLHETHILRFHGGQSIFLNSKFQIREFRAH